MLFWVWVSSVLFWFCGLNNCAVCCFDLLLVCWTGWFVWLFALFGVLCIIWFDLLLLVTVKLILNCCFDWLFWLIVVVDDLFVFGWLLRWLICYLKVFFGLVVICCVVLFGCLALIGWCTCWLVVTVGVVCLVVSMVFGLLVACWCGFDCCLWRCLLVVWLIQVVFVLFIDFSCWLLELVWLVCWFELVWVLCCSLGCVVGDGLCVLAF